MKKNQQLTFYKADFIKYQTVLSDLEIYNKVADFLLKYVSIESFYKKLLISNIEKNGKTLTKSEKRNLKINPNRVDKVLKYYGLYVEKGLIEKLFGNNNKNYMVCSIKMLRNRLVHNVNSNVIKAILERYDDITRDLDDFINAIKK